MSYETKPVQVPGTQTTPTPPHSYSHSPLSRSIGSYDYEGHGPQPYPNAKPIRSSSKSRRYSSSHGLKSPKSSSPSGPPLNTNSPIALAAAAAVTPDKLARLLLQQGPLAIRHITSHLANTIPGFADLSLSKQRRLIIAVLDSDDPANGVSFEKVGWGRWAAFKRGEQPASTTHQYAPHQKSKRRESITAEAIKPPSSPLLRASEHGVRHSNGVWADDVDLADDDMMFHNSEPKPVFDDDDEFEDDDEDEDGLQRPRRPSRSDRQETDEEDWQSMGAASLRGQNRYGFSNAPYSHTRTVSITDKREKEAIDALVQLASI